MEEPDHFLEEYWKLFKEFIKKLHLEFPIVKNFIDLDDMVSNLNFLKEQSKFIEIERSIEKYVVQVGWVLIKHCNTYYRNIYHAQLKRWDNVPSFLGDLHEKKKIKYLKHIDDSSFIMYLMLLNNLSDSIHQIPYITLFSQLHVPNYDDKYDVIKCHEYNIKRIIDIIPKIVEDKKVGALTILSNYIDLREIMLELYNIKVSRNMDGRKILNLLHKLNI